MTLVEVLLALFLTSLVAATVATMLFSLSSGMRSQKDLRQQNTKALVLAHRLEATIHSASSILAGGDNFVVLWMGDTRHNEKPNLSELCRVEYDAAKQQVLAYAALANLADGDDVVYELSADFAGITAALKASEKFPSTPYGNGVISGTFANADAANHMLAYNLVLTGEQETYRLRATVALRSR